MAAAKKLVRSALVRFPQVYDAATGQWRYRLYYRLGMVHEREFRALPLIASAPDALVLDVGGNNGQSILSIKRVLPDARVITFEPASRHRRDLDALGRRLSNVEVRPYALADVDGEADLYWPVYNGMAMHGLASLDRDEAMSFLDADRVYGFDERLLEPAHERVTMRRLDGLELDPDIVKIDVQGTEQSVLTGGLETIRRCRPAIMAEALEVGGPAHELLAPLDYGLYTFGEGRFEAGADPSATNHFLLPNERVRA